MISAKQARELTNGRDRFTCIMDKIRIVAMAGKYELIIPTEEMTAECEGVLRALGYEMTLLGHEGYLINWEYKGYTRGEK